MSSHMRIGVACLAAAMFGVPMVDPATTASASASPSPSLPSMHSGISAPLVVPAPAIATSTFQLSIDRNAYTATLPTSSVATYVLPSGSSTLVPTETTTSGSALTLKLSQQAPISASGANPSLPQIEVDSSTTYQEIEGFGGAMTDSSSYVINTSPDKAAILSDLFGSSGAGLNIVRVPLGASDMTRGSNLLGNHMGFETYDDTSGDTSLAHFSIAHDATNTIPVLQAAKKLDSGLKLIATPWSAPGWMKIRASS